MDAVSSVTAFVFRYIREPTEPEAREIFTTLSVNEQRVLRVHLAVRDSAARLRRLVAETGEAWTPARYARVEAAALNRLRAELTQRRLLVP